MASRCKAMFLLFFFATFYCKLNEISLVNLLQSLTQNIAYEKVTFSDRLRTLWFPLGISHRHKHKSLNLIR